MSQNQKVHPALWLILIAVVLFVGHQVRHHLWPRQERAHSGAHPWRPPPEMHTSSNTFTGPASATPLKGKRPKLRHRGSEARLRLQPGETMVLPYHGHEPGRVEVAMFTPEPREDGTIALQTRLVSLPDDAQLRVQAQELYPDLYAADSPRAVSASRLTELMRSLADEKESKVISYPSISSRAGAPVSIRNVVRDPRFDEDVGLQMQAQVDKHTGDEAMEVSVKLDHSDFGEETDE